MSAADVERVLERARVLDITVPLDIRRTGSCHEVKWSNGDVTWEYGNDLESYRRDVGNGLTDPRRSWRRAVPEPVSRWSRERRRAFLDLHRNCTPGSCNH